MNNKQDAHMTRKLWTARSSSFTPCGGPVAIKAVCARTGLHCVNKLDVCMTAWTSLDNVVCGHAQHGVACTYPVSSLWSVTEDIFSAHTSEQALGAPVNS